MEAIRGIYEKAQKKELTSAFQSVLKVRYYWEFQLNLVRNT